MYNDEQEDDVSLDLEYLADLNVFERRSMFSRTSDLRSKIVETENLIDSREYLSDLNVYTRRYMMYRTSDLRSKVVINDENASLPKNAMLHMLDNFGHSDHTTDTFEPKTYPFIDTRKNLKYVYNFTDLDSLQRADLDKFSSRLYRPRLYDNLRAFAKAHRRILIPTAQIDMMMDNRNAVLITNYNPLYRVVATNNRPISQYFRYRAIFSAILRNAAKCPRNNFLVVPIPAGFTYLRSNIFSMVATGTVSNQKLLSHSHFYFFMIDLVALLLNPESDLSTFKILDNRSISDLNVMLVHGDKSIIFNLGTVAGLADNKVRIFGILDVVANIANGGGIASTEPDLETFTNEEVPLDELADVFADAPDITEVLNTIKSHSNPSTCYGVRSSNGEIVSSCVIIHNFPGDTFGIDHPITILTVVYTQPEYRNQGHAGNLIRFVLSKNTPPIYLSTLTTNSSAQHLYERLGFKLVGKTNTIPVKNVMMIGKDDIVAEEPKTVQLISGVSPVSSVLPVIKPVIPTQNIVEDEVKPDVSIIHQPDPVITKPTPTIDVNRVDTFINKTENLTAKQKDRAVILSTKYKSIILDTPNGKKSIHEIISEPTDFKLKTKVYPPSLQVPDVDMAKSSAKEFDTQYHEKLLDKDILTNIVAFHDNGLFLTGYEQKHEYNAFTRVKHVKASFEDIHGKKHTVIFKLPIPDSEGYYLVNGIKLSMSKQLVNVPICKISPTRVSLISNYSKTLVEKVQSSRNTLTTYLTSNSTDLGLKIVPKNNTYIGISVPFEYKLLGDRYSKLTSATHEFYFEYANRFNHFIPEAKKASLESLSSKMTEFESHYGVLVGKVIRSKDEFIFMDKHNLCSVVNVVSNNVIESGKSIVTFLSDKISIPFEWCNLKILDKDLPIVFVLAYKYGLSAVLENIGAKHRFISSSTRQAYDLKPTELMIKFSDGALIFDRYPLVGSYVLAGLSFFSSLRQYRLSDLDDKNMYYQILADKGMSINYLKGISAYFSFFIDPITRDVLTEMKEPTNTRDLLVRAVQMLINDTDKAPSSISNFRVRSAEKIPGIIYNEISRQYANYVNNNFKDVSFSINTEAIFQRIIQDQTVAPQETINPIHAIKDTNKVSYTGFGGRTATAFVERDRAYPKDAIGILSETTTDSGSVGMTGALSSDAKITNLRGMFNTTTDVDKMSPSNILSDVALLLPGSTQDD